MITSNVIFLLLLPLVVNARGEYRAKVPNGVNSPGNCDGWGHTNCNGGGSQRDKTGGRTAVVGASGTWTDTQCLADSDLDGYNNGEELGDACCYGWTSGNVDAAKGVSSTGGTDTRISNPRDGSSMPTTWSEGPITTGADIKKFRTASPEAFAVTTAARDGTDITITFGRAAFACHYKVQVSTVIDFTSAVTDYDFSQSDVPKSSAPGMYLSSTTFDGKTCPSCAPESTTTYYVRIVATNHMGSTTSTNVITVAGVTASVPTAPTSLTSTAGNAQVILNWQVPSSDGGASITGYKIEMETGGVGGYAVLVETQEATTYTKTGLTNGVSYKFKISAINSVGTSTVSNPETTSIPITVTGVVTNIAGAAGDTQIVLTWDAPSNIGGSAITGYKIFMQTGTGGAFDTGSNTGSTTTELTKTGLTNGVSYKFKIETVNGAGTSAAAIQSSFTIPVTVPNAPTAVSAASGDTELVVSWSAPVVTGGSAITGYKIEMQTAETGNYDVLVADTTSTTGTATTYTKTGLTNGVNYRFQIYAITSAGTSAASTTSTSVQPSAASISINAGVASVSKTADVGVTTFTGLQAQGKTPSADVVVTISVTGNGCTVGTAPYKVTLTSGNKDLQTFDINIGAAVGDCTVSFATESTDAAYNAITVSDLTIKVESLAGPPTSLAAVATGITKTIKLDWVAVTSVADTGNTAITGYLIQKSIDDGTTWIDIVHDLTTVTLTESGFTNAVEVSIRIASKNSIGVGAWSATVKVTPCTAGLSFVAKTDLPFVLGGLGTDNINVGKLFLTCPISTTNAVILASVTSTTLDTCVVASGQTSLTLSADVTVGVDVFMKNVAASDFKTDGGICQFTFNPSSTVATDTPYDDLATTAAITVTTVKQSSLKLSVATLSLTSGCAAANSADETITVTTCGGQTNCLPSQNAPAGLKVTLISSDISVCTVPTTAITLSTSATTTPLPITPTGTGTCTVTMTTESSDAASVPYTADWSSSYPSVVVTVTGSKTMTPSISNWNVKYLKCDDEIKFDVTATAVSNKWISFGWSDTAQMSKSDVIICSPGNSVIQRHWLPGYVPDAGINLASTTAGTCSSDGTATTMSFRRKIIGTGSKQYTLMNKKDTKVVWAVGNIATVNLAQAHTSRGDVTAAFVLSTEDGTDTTPTDSTTTSPSPSIDDSVTSAIEKELRVAGLEKFETIDENQKLGMTWTLTNTNVEMAIKVKGHNKGFVSLAFPVTPGIMKGADAISGDASGVKAWRLSARNIESEKEKDYFVSSSIVIEGDYMTMKFKIKADGSARRLYSKIANSLISLKRTVTGTATDSDPSSHKRRNLLDVIVSSKDTSTNLLWSSHESGSFAKGVIHTKRGASTVNFKSGGNDGVKAPATVLPLTHLTSTQHIISLVIALGAILLTVIGGGIVTVLSASDKPEKVDWLTQKYITLPYLVKLRVGEWSVWFVYFIGMVGFFVYRIALISNIYEVQKALGWIACWTGFVAAFPALQSSMLLKIFGIPFERSIKHHRMAGRWFWIFQTAHLIVALTYLDIGTLIGTFEAPSLPLRVVYGWGFLAWAVTTLIAITAVYQVRRKQWEIFYYTHVVLTKICYLFGVLHLQGSMVGMVLMGLPIAVWMVENIGRKCIVQKNFTVSIAKTDDSTTFVEVNTKDVVVCTEPGDYCFITFPQISKIERHPFSVASQPGIKNIQFRIKNMGENSFTGKLHRYVTNMMKAEDLQIEVTGPYGKLSVDLTRYQNVVLAAGGIGVTPMISTLHWLYDQYKLGNLKQLKKVLFVWTVRYEKQLSWCNDILSKLKKCSEIFTVQLYVTRPVGKSVPSSSVSKNAYKSNTEVDLDADEGIEMTNQTSGKRSQVSPSPETVWKAVNDADTGKTYYHNQETDETTWVRPSEMDSTSELVRPSVNTSTPNAVDEESPLEWIKGRPKFNQILTEFLPDGTCVLACGPTPMVVGVEKESNEKGMHFHKEIFSF